MSSRTRPDVAAVRAAVEAVPDPELPPVTIGMLGMLHDLTVEDRHVRVELLPTASGCPATEVIAADVRAAVGQLDGVDAVEVRFRWDPPWTSDRISAAGRAALRSFGVAPPPSGGGDDGRAAGTRPPLAGDAGVACPYCGSTSTTRDSLFGPTPCRSLHRCPDCRQPFEAFDRL